MTLAEISIKASELTTPGWGREVSRRLIDTVFGIEELADSRNLRRLLQRG
jgi:hypothetical protein